MTMIKTNEYTTLMQYMDSPKKPAFFIEADGVRFEYDTRAEGPTPRDARLTAIKHNKENGYCFVMMKTIPTSSITNAGLNLTSKSAPTSDNWTPNSFTPTTVDKAPTTPSASTKRVQSCSLSR